MALAWPERGLQSRQQRCVNPVGLVPRAHSAAAPGLSREVKRDKPGNDSLSKALLAPPGGNAPVHRHGLRYTSVRPLASRPKGFPMPAKVTIAPDDLRSEEHTSELQSLMRISYAVFCL